MKNLYYLLLTIALLIYSACSANNFVPDNTTVSLDGSGPAISPNGGGFYYFRIGIDQIR
ncbi:MAG: hypothetical protein KA885_10760 [Spirochaetes bacterium]|nr:hypothetical protein [Spirochaetota bacterium]